MIAWSEFSDRLDRRGLSFAEIVHASEKIRVIQSLGISDPLLVGEIETLWRRYDETTNSIELPKTGMGLETVDLTSAQEEAGPERQSEDSPLNALDEAVLALLGFRCRYLKPAGTAGTSLVVNSQVCPRQHKGLFDQLAPYVGQVHAVRQGIELMKTSLSGSVLLGALCHAASEEFCAWQRNIVATVKNFAMVQGIDQPWMEPQSSSDSRHHDQQPPRIDSTALLTELKPHLLLMDHLDSFVHIVKQFRTGDAIITALQHKLTASSVNVNQYLPAHRECDERLLRALLWPYYTILSRWLLTGKLEDPTNEFFIRLDRTSAVSVSSMVSQGAVRVAGSPFVADLGRCPAFLRDFAYAVVHTGAYTRMMDCVDGKTARGDPTGTQNWGAAELVAVDNEAAIEDDVRALAEELIKHSMIAGSVVLAHTIQKAYHRASCAVVRCLLTSGELPLQLELIKRLYFNTGADWNSELLETIDIESGFASAHRGPSQDPVGLRMTRLLGTRMAESLARHGLREEDDSPESSTAAGPSAAISRFSYDEIREQFFESFMFTLQMDGAVLDYIPPTQLNLIFTPDVCRRMSVIFKWLYRLRMALFKWERRVWPLTASKFYNPYIRQEDRCFLFRAHKIGALLLSHTWNDVIHPGLEDVTVMFSASNTSVEDCRVTFTNFVQKVSQRTFGSGEPLHPWCRTVVLLEKARQEVEGWFAAWGEEGTNEGALLDFMVSPSTKRSWNDAENSLLQMQELSACLCL
jgi:hypothetical protein